MSTLLRRRRALSVLAFAAAGLAPAAVPPAHAGDTPGSTAHHAKVVIIGIDAVSFDVLDPLMERGVTPHMAALARAGARGDLASVWPLRTPQVWTSVATGKLPGQHGIWDHISSTYFVPPAVRTKQKRPVTSADRRSKALWTILGERHKRSLVVGWVSTWPAERVPGSLIVAPVRLSGDRRQTTIKGSFYRDAGRMVADNAQWPRVRDLIVEPSDIAPEEVARFIDEPPANSPLYALPSLERYVYAIRWSLARARSVEQITTALAAEVEPDMVMAYFQCPDSLLHRFWIFHKPLEAIRQRLDGHGIPSQHAAELKRRFGRAVDACYRDVDERVGRILAATRGEDTTVLLVSDHGFGDAPVPHRMKGEPYSGDHKENGFIIAVGPNIAPGTVLRHASVLDVAPTTLHLLGLPVASDMRGKVLQDLFQADFFAERPIQAVATYEKEPQREGPYSEGWPLRKDAR